MMMYKQLMLGKLAYNLKKTRIESTQNQIVSKESNDSKKQGSCQLTPLTSGGNMGIVWDLSVFFEISSGFEPRT